MFFAPVTRRTAYLPQPRAIDRSLERFLVHAFAAPGTPARPALEQDEQSFRLQLDLPGVAKDQLTLGIEGKVVHIATEGAARSFKASYELPQAIDAANSEATLENGVLSLRLAKSAPESKVVPLAIA
ncbi:MAG: Hsp20/alpha crystallin family protein [Xylophilus ampelinus]